MMQEAVKFLANCIIVVILYKLLSGNRKMSFFKLKAKHLKIKKSAATTKTDVKTDFDDELTTFLLNSLGLDFDDDIKKPFNHTKAKKPSGYIEGQWLGPNESVKIKGRKLNRGFIYLGSFLESLDGCGTDPALIVTTYPASSPKKKAHTSNQGVVYDPLHFWVGYAGLSKDRRGIFLDWLASKRSNPNIDIGYIFIYFYGLERRIIADTACYEMDESEFIAIFNEVVRLRKIYGNDKTFNDKSSNFLQLMAILRTPPVKKYSYELPQNEISFRVELAEVAKNKKPVDADLAFKWLAYFSDYLSKMPAMRCEAMFKKLFTLQYKEKFAAGIKIKPNKAKIPFGYHPANPSINTILVNINDLSDPSTLALPLNKIKHIALICLEKLTAYSRYLGRAGSSENDVTALMLLPDELINESGSQIINNFRQWADKIMSKTQGLTTVKAFWSHIQKELPKTINKKEHQLMQQLAEKSGFGIAPDIRFYQEKMRPDEKVVLFKFNPEHDTYFEPDEAFNQVSISLKMGAMIATTNGHINEKKRIILKNLIDHNNTLSPVKKSSLHAYLAWRLNTSANMVGIKARLETVDSNEKQCIRQLLISVALAGGQTGADEIKQIEKFYTVLGLDKSLVPSDIHSFSSNRIAINKTTRRLVDKQKNTLNSRFELDAETLALHKQETHAVQAVLRNIFTDDATEEIQKSGAEMVTDLDDAHQTLYEKLITKEKWIREDIVALCEKLCLMVDGAIETINDWSFENVDAPLIDDDDGFCIDFEVVKELRG